MPGITVLGSVVASGAGYAPLALDPPSAVLQRPQPATYDRHRASYCAESTRFWNGTFETECEPQKNFSHECQADMRLFRFFKMCMYVETVFLLLLRILILTKKIQEFPLYMRY